jgi:hypothetical protein
VAEQDGRITLSFRHVAAAQDDTGPDTWQRASYTAVCLSHCERVDLALSEANERPAAHVVIAPDPDLAMLKHRVDPTVNGSNPHGHILLPNALRAWSVSG